jgi:hypothetical protein
MDQPNHVPVCEFVQLGDTANFILHKFAHVYFIMYFTIEEDSGALLREAQKQHAMDMRDLSQTFSLVTSRHTICLARLFLEFASTCMHSFRAKTKKKRGSGVDGFGVRSGGILELM